MSNANTDDVGTNYETVRRTTRQTSSSRTRPYRHRRPPNVTTYSPLTPRLQTINVDYTRGIRGRGSRLDRIRHQSRRTVNNFSRSPAQRSLRSRVGVQSLPQVQDTDELSNTQTSSPLTLTHEDESDPPIELSASPSSRSQATPQPPPPVHIDAVSNTSAPTTHLESTLVLTPGTRATVTITTSTATRSNTTNNTSAETQIIAVNSGETPGSSPGGGLRFDMDYFFVEEEDWWYDALDDGVSPRESTSPQPRLILSDISEPLTLDSDSLFQYTDADVKVISVSESQANSPCTICLDRFQGKQKVGELPCGHMFHMRCINRWLVRSKTCPLCRRDIVRGRRLSGRSAGQA